MEEGPLQPCREGGGRDWAGREWEDAKEVVGGMGFGGWEGCKGAGRKEEGLLQRCGMCVLKGCGHARVACGAWRVRAGCAWRAQGVSKPTCQGGRAGGLANKVQRCAGAGLSREGAGSVRPPLLPPGLHSLPPAATTLPPFERLLRLSLTLDCACSIPPSSSSTQSPTSDPSTQSLHLVPPAPLSHHQTSARSGIDPYQLVDAPPPSPYTLPDQSTWLPLDKCGDSK